jgi:hypothetical protein
MISIAAGLLLRGDWDFSERDRGRADDSPEPLRVESATAGGTLVAADIPLRD